MISHKVRRRRYHTQLPGSRGRKNRRKEHLSTEHIILRGQAVLLQDHPSTRGIGAIREAYRNLQKAQHGRDGDATSQPASETGFALT